MSLITDIFSAGRVGGKIGVTDSGADWPRIFTDFGSRDKNKYPYYRYGIRDITPNTERVIGILFQNHDGIF